MGVFDKLKNIFFEEEYVEVEEPEKPVKPAKQPKKEQPKKEKSIAKKVELNEMPKVKEEKSAREREIEEEVIERVEKKGISDNATPKRENNFKFPMTFEEDDFTVDSFDDESKEKLRTNKSEKKVEKTHAYTGELYSNNSRSDSNTYNSYTPKREEYKSDYSNIGVYEAGDYNKEQKIFRPTPIISPIYGILDKNYKKDEIVQKKEIRITSASSRKVDLDTVREKAYGDLASDITASMMENESKEDEKKIESEDVSVDDSLYDLTDNDHPVVSNVTVGDAEEYFNDLGLEYNVDYKDNKKEKATGRRSDKKNLESSEDSLFDLIDSMYKDSEEE